MNIFERALKVLDERGWSQGQFMSESGAVCVQGAISIAMVDTNLDLVGDEYGKACQQLNIICGQPAYKFNDDPTTSEEDVRLLLKHAAYAWNENDRIL